MLLYQTLMLLKFIDWANMWNKLIMSNKITQFLHLLLAMQAFKWLRLLAGLRKLEHKYYIYYVQDHVN